MNNFLPLMLDLSGKKVVIFGGGEVGERKASLFCDYARVVVISREFAQGLNLLSEKGKIKLVKVNDLDVEEIALHIKDAFIAIPATNNRELNQKIAGIANQNRVLVNRVDDHGDIVVPSVIRRGDIVIGISTFGKSPALSKYIRQRIEGVITPEFAGMSHLLDEIREELKSEVEEQRKRKEILWTIINDNEVWVALGESYEKAYMIASKHIDIEKNE